MDFHRTFGRYCIRCRKRVYLVQNAAGERFLVQNAAGERFLVATYDGTRYC